MKPKLDEAQKQKLALALRAVQEQRERRVRNAFLVIVLTLVVNAVLTVAVLTAVLLK